MEAEWLADRSLLRQSLEQHPEWTNQQLADVAGRSLSWVKKWKKRLRQAPSEDEHSLFSQSRARRQPPAKTSPPVVEAILQIKSLGAEYESARKLLGQRRRRVFLQQPEKGTHQKADLQDT